MAGASLPAQDRPPLPRFEPRLTSGPRGGGALCVPFAPWVDQAVELRRDVAESGGALDPIDLAERAVERWGDRAAELFGWLLP